MFSRKWLQKATLQMKSMATKKINWDLYSWTLIFSKNIYFLKSPCSGLSCLSLFWALLSTAQIVHHIFCEHLENWNVHFLHNSSLLLSIFRLVWVFLWSKFTCQFRKCVLSMCAKQAEKNDTAKTAQHSRVVQWGEHVSEWAFSKEFFLRHLRLCVHGKSSLISRISHMNLSLTTVFPHIVSALE